MSVHRSPARPNYPGNYKEGELARGGGEPRGHDEIAKKVSVGWDELCHGPSLNEDQHSRGNGEMDGHETAVEENRDSHAEPIGRPGHHVDEHLNGVEGRKVRRNWP